MIHKEREKAKLLRRPTDANFAVAVYEQGFTDGINHVFAELHKMGQVKHQED